MRFPVIRVRDKLTGHEHIVGTNSHDHLYVDDETGGIQYVNLQNMTSTDRSHGDNEYSFVAKEDEYEPFPYIEFVTFDELLELYKQNIAMSCEQEREIRDMLKKFIEKQRKENRLDEDEGEIQHTGGHYRY